MRKGFLIFEELGKYFPIYEEVWISLYMRKILFSLLSVQLTCTAGKNSCRQRKNERWGLLCWFRDVLAMQWGLRRLSGDQKTEISGLVLSLDLWKREMLCFFPPPGTRRRRSAQRPQSEPSKCCSKCRLLATGKSRYIFSWVGTSSLFLQNFLPGRLVDFR